MKYIKFTYVDSVTNVSVAAEPTANGPKFPPVAGLQFVWARESDYPTDVPSFFGTCPDGSDTQIDGVLGVFGQVDWEQMQADEMARRPTQVLILRAEAQRIILDRYPLWVQANYANGIYPTADADVMRAAIASVVTESNRVEDILLAGGAAFPVWPVI